MNYNSFSKPRFYINTLEFLYNKGLVNTIHPIFLSSNWHKPQEYTGQNFEFTVSNSGLLKDVNYIMLIGVGDSAENVTNAENSFLNNPKNDNVGDTKIYTISDFSSNANLNTFTLSVSGYISGISIGNYYDLPYNPDLGIKKTISYDGVESQETIGGKSFSTNYGSSKPYNPFKTYRSEYSSNQQSFRLGDINQDGVLNIVDIVNIVGYVLSQDNQAYDEIQKQIADVNQDGLVNIVDIVTIVGAVLNESTLGDIIINEAIALSRSSSRTSYRDIDTPSGRRSYDISYSYIGSDSNGQNYIFPRDLNYSNDLRNLSDTSDAIYDSGKSNLYTSVINKTMGSHIPFVFSLDGENSSELMLARFKENSFEFTEQAPNVHSVNFGIREVW